MNLYIAFLRGINLGKRQIKMAELRACLEDEGFGAVRTVLASGNVCLEALKDEAETKAHLEGAIEKRFGFPVGVVLRSEAEVRAMLAARPFAGLDPGADATRHVLLFDQDLPEGVALPDRPGHTEIVRIGRREIFFVGYRQPNGRYTEGVEDVLKPLYAQLGKGVLDTMRNWNTMEKVLA